MLKRGGQGLEHGNSSPTRRGERTNASGLPKTAHWRGSESASISRRRRRTRWNPAADATAACHTSKAEAAGTRCATSHINPDAEASTELPRIRSAWASAAIKRVVAGGGAL